MGILYPGRMISRVSCSTNHNVSTYSSQIILVDSLIAALLIEESILIRLLPHLHS
jgi:hypothetical protein